MTRQNAPAVAFLLFHRQRFRRVELTNTETHENRVSRQLRCSIPVDAPWAYICECCVVYCSRAACLCVHCSLSVLLHLAVTSLLCALHVLYLRRTCSSNGSPPAVTKTVLMPW